MTHLDGTIPPGNAEAAPAAGPARDRGRAAPLGRGGALAAVATLALAELAAVGLGRPAHAQSIPGLVVTTTPPAAGPAIGPPPGGVAPPGIAVARPGPPPAAPAPQAAPPPKEAKPKPKPKPRKEASAASPAVKDDSTSQGIVALVNDDPITAFEVQELARFLTLSVNFTDRAKANMKVIAENPKTTERLKAILQETIQQNQGKTREQIIAIFEERKKQFVMSLQQQAVASAKASFVPGLRKKALDELVEDRLKFQEAKKLNIIVPDEEVERAFRGIAEKNNMTSAQFEAHIRAQGADARTMKSRFKATFTWREVIRRKFGHQISVSSREVDRIAAAAGGKADELVELQVQKVTLAAGGGADQARLAQAWAEAEAMRQRFGGCKTTAALVKGRANAKVEDMGFRRASTLAEPTRSLLLSAGEGEMIPATLTSTGAELYAVCSRRTGRVDEQKRQAAENELQMKEFERLATRHLADLRKDALIEIKER